MTRISPSEQPGRACTQCGGSESGFYAGHSKCKDCVRARARKHRADNLERVRAYDVRRSKRPERKERFAAWLREHWKKYPKIRAAQIKVGNAIRDKKLFKAPCEVCGNAKAHAHHDDYDKPLQVRWLCVIHHAEWHQKNGPGANID